MTMRRILVGSVLLLVIAGGGALAQEHSTASAPTSQQSSEPDQAGPQQRPSKDRGLEAELAEESREAAGEDEQAEFKQSATVRWLARATGLKPLTAYWVFVALNFAIILALLIAILKSRVPGMFRARTQAIRKGMEEAQKASEEARRRLSDIESRLAKLDAEIAAMSASADTEAKKEEERLRAAEEEDKRKIVEAAEQEIMAAARLARAELRAYVSELAVSLAEKRIQVSPTTDQELVRAFVEQLGKDGQ
jgi:F-type H+-transporting ATPase subunit b